VLLADARAADAGRRSWADPSSESFAQFSSFEQALPSEHLAERAVFAYAPSRAGENSPAGEPTSLDSRCCAGTVLAPDTAHDQRQIIRRAYAVAEKVDIKGWTDCFTPDGTFTDMSINVTYRGPAELGKTVEVYAKAFPDMHRELFRFFSMGDIVVVELALQGTHTGPLPTPMGVVPPTGKRMDAPCCDVFRLVDGKIQSFNCYPSGTVIFAQLGILENIKGSIDRG
jgi:ketosteroid isomerase-like protein